MPEKATSPEKRIAGQWEQEREFMVFAPKKPKEEKKDE